MLETLTLREISSAAFWRSEKTEENPQPPHPPLFAGDASASAASAFFASSFSSCRRLFSSFSGCLSSSSILDCSQDQSTVWDLKPYGEKWKFEIWGIWLRFFFFFWMGSSNVRKICWGVLSLLGSWNERNFTSLSASFNVLSKAIKHHNDAVFWFHSFGTNGWGWNLYLGHVSVRFDLVRNFYQSTLELKLNIVVKVSHDTYISN